ncbi:MAG: type II secretion system protein N [Pseudomonadota bacterium]
MAVIGRQEINHRVTDAITAGQNKARRFFAGRAAQRQSVLAPRLVEGVLVILLGILLALTALQLFAPLPLPQGDVVTSVERPAAPAQDFVVKNPFPVTAAAPILDEDPLDVVDTTLDLKLTGVWTDEEIGSATIETPDGKQSRFAVGEEIINGVRLEQVFADQVIINRAGARESLRFESKTAVASQPRSAPRPELRQAPAALATPERQGGFTDFLRLAPATDEEGNFAVDIYAARDRQTFNAYGFRDGDRVLSINGTPPPTNPAALSAMLSALQRDGEAVIVVRRGEREIPVTMSLEGIGNR